MSKGLNEKIISKGMFLHKTRERVSAARNTSSDTLEGKVDIESIKTRLPVFLKNSLIENKVSIQGVQEDYNKRVVEAYKNSDFDRCNKNSLNEFAEKYIVKLLYWE
ncbi:MAG: hypothetical protein NUV46_04245 [Nanoarchaeota archaeon]|nr:hypothetical protein [Nanoarchaeota archaeon]